MIIYRYGRYVKGVLLAAPQAEARIWYGGEGERDGEAEDRGDSHCAIVLDNQMAFT